MKNNLKKKIAFMLSILAISSSLAVTASAIQLGGGVSSGSYHGYLYADVPSSGYVASETTQHVWTLMSIPLHTVHQEAQKQATMRVLQIDLLPATLRFLYLTIHMYLVGIEHILLPM